MSFRKVDHGLCYAYVIGTVIDDEDVCLTKVGISSNPKGRLSTLQNASPHKLFMYHAYAFPDRKLASMVEQAFHTVLKEYRASGEWFHLSTNEAHRYMCSNIRGMVLLWLFDNHDTGEDLTPSSVYESVVRLHSEA